MGEDMLPLQLRLKKVNYLKHTASELGLKLRLLVQSAQPNTQTNSQLYDEIKNEANQEILWYQLMSYEPIHSLSATVTDES